MLPMGAGRGPAGRLCPGTLKVPEPEISARRCFQARQSGSTVREGPAPVLLQEKVRPGPCSPTPEDLGVSKM